MARAPRLKKTERADAIKAQTEVAVDVGYKGADWTPAESSARRALILADGQSREVYSPGERWRGHDAGDGVRVRYLEAHPGGGVYGDVGAEHVVAPHDVIMVWDEFAKLRDERVGEQAQRRAELEARKARAEAAAAALGGRVDALRDRYFRVYGYRVVLSIEEAEKLVREK